MAWGEQALKKGFVEYIFTLQLLSVLRIMGGQFGLRREIKIESDIAKTQYNMVNCYFTQKTCT